MIDREVVITHLDDLRLFADVTVHPVVSPDNWDVYSNLCDYIDQIKTEVEMLLKEQEPMMVRLTTSTIRCPRCGKQITSRGATHREIKFCWKCGQAVKWERVARD